MLPFFYIGLFFPAFPCTAILVHVKAGKMRPPRTSCLCESPESSAWQLRCCSTTAPIHISLCTFSFGESRNSHTLTFASNKTSHKFHKAQMSITMQMEKHTHMCLNTTSRRMFMHVDFPCWAACECNSVTNYALSNISDFNNATLKLELTNL